MMMGVLVDGGKLVTLPKFDPEMFLKALDSHKVAISFIKKTFFIIKLYQTYFDAMCTVIRNIYYDSYMSSNFIKKLGHATQISIL